MANTPGDMTTEEVRLGRAQKKYYMIGDSQWAKSILARLLDNEPQVVTPSNHQELSDTPFQPCQGDYTHSTHVNRHCWRPL